MAQRRLAGRRCRTVQLINTHSGPVQRGTYGTIRHEMYNLGRRIVFVAWDTGLDAYVFPKEIEILAEEERIAA
jgi:uncharacterized protein (UPF0276 family)